MAPRFYTSQPVCQLDLAHVLAGLERRVNLCTLWSRNLHGLSFSPLINKFSYSNWTGVSICFDVIYSAIRTVYR